MAWEEQKELSAVWRGKRRWEVCISTTSWTASKCRRTKVNAYVSSEWQNRNWGWKRGNIQHYLGPNIYWWAEHGVFFHYNCDLKDGASCPLFPNSADTSADTELLRQNFNVLSPRNNNYSPSLFSVYTLSLNHGSVCRLWLLLPSVAKSCSTKSGKYSLRKSKHRGERRNTSVLTGYFK